MSSSIRSVICFVSLLVVGALAASDDCAGGHSNGEEVTSGSYYYKCTGGKLVPTGCISDDGRKVPVGQGWNAKGNQEKTCVLNGASLTMKVTACYTDGGQRVAPNSEVDVGTTTFKCKADGDAWCLGVSGCGGSNKAALDAKVVVGDQVMKCTKTGAKEAKLVAIGCLKGGTQYDIGAQFDDDKATYRCGLDSSKTKTMAKTYGCIKDGKRVFDLDLYREGDMFYRCRVNEDSVDRDLYGYAYRDDSGSYIPKVIGCSWETGSAPYRFFTCCVREGSVARVRQLYCLYQVNGGDYAINEGCYRTINGQGVGCKRDANDKLSVTQFDPKDALQNRMSLC